MYISNPFVWIGFFVVIVFLWVNRVFSSVFFSGRLKTCDSLIIRLIAVYQLCLALSAAGRLIESTRDILPSFFFISLHVYVKMTCFSSSPFIKPVYMIDMRLQSIVCKRISLIVAFLWNNLFRMCNRYERKKCSSINRRLVFAFGIWDCHANIAWIACVGSR